jgi:hypothetical protein
MNNVTLVARYSRGEKEEGTQEERKKRKINI